MKVVFASLIATAAAGDWDAGNAARDWADYKMFFGKVYNGDDADDAHRASFESNIAFIKEQNAKGENLKFGPNQFTDLNQEEFKASAGFGFIPADDFMGSTPILGNHIHQGETLAAAVDWEQQGSVTAVKDQGQCGSCWSFSTTGGLEGAWKNAAGSLTSMSEQQFMDCSTQNMGCNGGNVGLALTYAEGASVATDASYSYSAVQGSCKSSYSAAIPNGGVTGYSRVGGFFSTSVNDMKSALAKGPVSVAIQADQRSFQMYSSGILSADCGSQLDHAVLVVGYGTEDGQEYWRIKNSWASSWGDHGYIRMATSTNVCGVLNRQAVYPHVSSSVAV